MTKRARKDNCEDGSRDERSRKALDSSVPAELRDLLLELKAEG